MDLDLKTIGQIRALTDPDSRVINAARVLEFIVDTLSGESGRALSFSGRVGTQVSVLGSQLYDNVRFAIHVRHSIGHVIVTLARPYTDNEKMKAVEYLLTAVQILAPQLDPEIAELIVPKAVGRKEKAKSKKRPDSITQQPSPQTLNGVSVEPKAAISDHLTAGSISRIELTTQNAISDGSSSRFAFTPATKGYPAFSGVIGFIAFGAYVLLAWVTLTFGSIGLVLVGTAPIIVVAVFGGYSQAGWKGLAFYLLMLIGGIAGVVIVTACFAAGVCGTMMLVLSCISEEPFSTMQVRLFAYGGTVLLIIMSVLSVQFFRWSDRWCEATKAK